jgi:hypothetical protein
MKPFVVPPESQGQWLNLGNLVGDGTHLQIKFDPVHGMIVQRTIPAAVMEQATQDNRYQLDHNKKGALIGNTQKHWLPVCSIPKHIDSQWCDELGNPREDHDAWKAWKRRLNSNEFRNFRTSEHRL